MTGKHRTSRSISINAVTGRGTWNLKTPLRYKGKTYTKGKFVPKKIRVIASRIRSKAAVKREKIKHIKRAVPDTKVHRTLSRNIQYDSYCVPFGGGDGLNDLKEIFRVLNPKGEFRISFYIGMWRAKCLRKVGCKGKTFMGHTKKDKWRLSRTIPQLTVRDFKERYIDYIDSVFTQMIATYKGICPACPSGEIHVEFLRICFQVIRRKSA